MTIHDNSWQSLIVHDSQIATFSHFWLVNFNNCFVQVEIPKEIYSDHISV